MRRGPGALPAQAVQDDAQAAAGRTVIPVSGDDRAAKSVVLELADQLGFDGVDAGPLAESWRQQPGTPQRAVTRLCVSEDGLWSNR